ncbi:DUF1565 domain-containing protein [Nonomuraea sp. K274]|uniref:DUF1565 domain-containing protein n=1 Tax=Nonomuraea cypriaca TaxID=1187855 RepID=A0A931A894_9ACTN|nr:DUF1565 domain-containing protein [Nonomuraea cypriaca]MBF8188156.1 DUF1565 domain-containing protein [Nonomuraea cypriaca]
MNSARLIPLAASTAFLLALGPSRALAAGDGDYYVSPAGSDANAGTTSASPFATVQKALDTAPEGATVQLAPGTYSQDFVTIRPGVTVTGPADAVVKGGGGARIVQVRHADITLSGFTIDGLYGSPSSPDGYRDKLIYAMSTTPGVGLSRVRILGMTLKNAGGECVRLRYQITRSEVANSTVGPCGVYDFMFDGGGKNGEGVYIGTAPEQQGANGAPDSRPDVSRDNRVHHNVFDTQGNECVDVKENSTANIVEYNTCTGQKDPESAGLDSRGNGNVFRYNTSYGNVGAGVRLGGDTEADGVDNDVYGNVITGNAAGGIKFVRAPQRRICGNAMARNTDGNAVGDLGDQFNPVRSCRATAMP